MLNICKNPKKRSSRETSFYWLRSWWQNEIASFPSFFSIFHSGEVSAWANCLSRDILALLKLSQLITRRESRHHPLHPSQVSCEGEAGDFTSVRLSKHLVHPRTLATPVTVPIPTHKGRFWGSTGASHSFAVECSILGNRRDLWHSFSMKLVVFRLTCHWSLKKKFRDCGIWILGGTVKNI